MSGDNEWKLVPPDPPIVNAEFDHMNGLQRATESIRYNFLCFERWISPSGQFREWLRHNARVGAGTLIPALLVMPLVGLVLWQISGLVSMLTSIAGHSIILLVLVFLLLLAAKIFSAFTKR